MATRRELRQEIGRLTGDMLRCVATSNGTTTTFIDALRLAKGNGTLTGRIGWLSGGTSANLGQMVRVTGNVKQTTSITFADTPLPSATATGDEIELWNENGIGSWPDDVNAEINAAITTVSAAVTAPDEEIIDDFAFDDPYLDIPADWQYFGGLWYEDSDGLWIEIPPTEDFIEIDAQNRTLRLKGTARERADTYRVKLVGDIAATPLTTDSDQTSCDAEWLTAFVAYRLLLPRMRTGAGNDDDISTRMAFVKTQEEKTRGRARNRPQGIARRLW